MLRTPTLRDRYAIPAITILSYSSQGGTIERDHREEERQLLTTTRFDSDTPPLCLQGEWFLLRSDEWARGQEHFIHWYSERGQHWLEQRVAHLARHVDVKPQDINMRDLGYRWGSCGRIDTLNFHWRVMQLPPLIIDYIVVHELVHMHEPRHNTAFWRRVEQTLPDFAARKQWLAENGSRF